MVLVMAVMVLMLMLVVVVVLVKEVNVVIVVGMAVAPAAAEDGESGFGIVDSHQIRHAVRVQVWALCGEACAAICCTFCSGHHITLFLSRSAGGDLRYTRLLKASWHCRLSL